MTAESDMAMPNLPFGIPPIRISPSWRKIGSICTKEEPMTRTLLITTCLVAAASSALAGSITWRCGTSILQYDRNGHFFNLSTDPEATHPIADAKVAVATPPSGARGEAIVVTKHGDMFYKGRKCLHFDTDAGGPPLAMPPSAPATAGTKP
jgi:hypothetical protein